jgi:hypothetical protein
MKIPLCFGMFLVAGFIPLASAQLSLPSARMAAEESYAVSVIGGGIGFHSYTTRWYYVENPFGNTYYYNYPVHLFTRTQLYIFYEHTSLFHLGPVHVGIRCDMHYGISSGTKEDWLSYSSEIISTGGSTIGTFVGPKFSFVVPISDFSVAPFVATMFQYTYLASNGEGVSPSVSTRFHYANGWGEHIVGFSLGIGANVVFQKLIIAPEYRFFVAGGNSTTWDPTGPTVQDREPSFGAFVVSVGIRI